MHYCTFNLNPMSKLRVKENPTATEIAELFTAYHDYNRCRLIFMLVPKALE